MPTILFLIQSIFDWLIITQLKSTVADWLVRGNVETALFHSNNMHFPQNLTPFYYKVITFPKRTSLWFETKPCLDLVYQRSHLRYMLDHNYEYIYIYNIFIYIYIYIFFFYILFHLAIHYHLEKKCFHYE